LHRSLPSTSRRRRICNVACWKNAGNQRANPYVDQDAVRVFASPRYVSQIRQREPKNRERKKRGSARVLVQSCSKSGEAGRRNGPDASRVCHAQVSSNVPSCSDQGARSRPASRVTTAESGRIRRINELSGWVNIKRISESGVMATLRRPRGLGRTALATLGLLGSKLGLPPESNVVLVAAVCCHVLVTLSREWVD
jgi:hypothetical protein